MQNIILSNRVACYCYWLNLVGENHVTNTSVVIVIETSKSNERIRLYMVYISKYIKHCKYVNV
jgi:hypothetical protein